jgi:hypothetical protein
MPYVLHTESVWQFHCADFLDLLQLLAACLNIFILSGFVRDEPGLIRGGSVSGATIDMPGMLARFDCSFGEEALASYITHSQFGLFRRLRIRIARRIRRFGGRI